MRIGFGEDAHALGEGRDLFLANVLIEHSDRGALAHSDGDVVLHALCDALLSAYALPDIGHYFPPSDPQYKDMDSAEILRGVLEILFRHYPEASIVNISLVVTLDKPKLGSLRDDIRRNLAELLAIDVSQVGLSFKTSEGLALDHVQARATVLLN